MIKKCNKCDCVFEHPTRKRCLNCHPSPEKWTKEECSEKALLCGTRKEFGEKFGKYYKTACNYNFLEEICSHMPPPNILDISAEDCLKIAEQCGSKEDFKKSFSQYYQKLRRLGRYTDLDNIFEKFKPSKVECCEKAKKYNSKRAFLSSEDRHYYYFILKNKWEKELTKHFLKPKRYSFEECENAALSCNSKIEFRDKHLGEYQSACKRGFLAQITEHFPKTSACGFSKSSVINYYKKRNLDKVSFYFLKFENKDESFYKIGITGTSIKKRFYEYSSFYKINILGLCLMSPEDCYDIEKYFKNEIADYLYNPFYWKTGSTETFKCHWKCGILQDIRSVFE